MTARVIGLIELLDRGVADNKILTVAEVDPDTAAWRDIKDLPAGAVEEFRQLFREIGREKHKEVEIIAFHDRQRALAEIKEGLGIANS